MLWREGNSLSAATPLSGQTPFYVIEEREQCNMVGVHQNTHTHALYYLHTPSPPWLLKRGFKGSVEVLSKPASPLLGTRLNGVPYIIPIMPVLSSVFAQTILRYILTPPDTYYWVVLPLLCSFVPSKLLSGTREAPLFTFSNKGPSQL